MRRFCRNCEDGQCVFTGARNKCSLAAYYENANRAVRQHGIRTDNASISRLTLRLSVFSARVEHEMVLRR